MAFTRPTLREIVQRITSDIMGQVTGAVTFLRRSVLFVFAKVYGGAVHLVYGFLEWMVNQIFATTAETTYLEMIGSEIGLTRKAGSKATGNAAVTGTTGLVVDAGTRLQSSSGNIYLVDSNVTLVAGTGAIALTAEEVGTAYNEVGGIVLSFVTPLSGINSTATVDSAGLAGGLDTETDEELRSRILLRKRQPPHGGSIYDYQEWALEVGGVTRAWIVPEYFGAGTFGLAFVRDNDSSIIPTAAQIAIMKAYIQSHTDILTGQTVGIPVTADPGFIMITLTQLAVDLAIQIYPNTAAVQAAVLSRLADAIKTFGGPGQTIALSQLYEAIGSAAGEVRHRIISPTQDIAAATNQVHVLGTITFGEYT